MSGDISSVPCATRAALVLIGLTAVIAQVVLLRELLVVFYGNELSLGLMLASWLLWTAAGSGLLGKLKLAENDPARLVAYLEAGLALVFPATILGVRAAKGLVGAAPGELLGPVEVVLVSGAALGPLCGLSGWLFAAGSRLYARQSGAGLARATARVYLLEAVGSGAGGVLAGLLLNAGLGAFRIALLVGALNLLAGAGLALRGRRQRAALAALAAGLLLAPSGAERLERLSLGWLWRGFRLLEVRDSVYGNLAVVETEGSRTLYESGLVAGTAPDPATAEEAVHYALLQHPAPRRVLLIGGGWNGSLREALQHPTLERVEYVELDPAVLRVAARRFAEEWLPALSDGRLRVHARDGRLWMKSAAGGLDVIILNLPEPATAQLNRYYTLEFFREAAAKLAPGGVVALRVRAAEDYISPELAQFLGSIYRTLRQVFAEVVLLPGENVHFFCALRKGVMAQDAEGLLERLHARGIQTRYVREYYLRFRMTPLKVRRLEERLRSAADAPVNRDFRPIAYYFDVVLWGAQFGRGYGELLERAARVGWWPAALVTAVLVLVASVLAARGGRRRTAALAVTAMGFTMLALEVLLLVGFQVLYGYVYHQLSLLIGAFMAGMALGSWRAAARSASGRDVRTLGRLQVMAAAAGLGLLLIFRVSAEVSGGGVWLGGYLLFPALAVGCGWLGGYQFPVASRVYFGAQTAGGAGALYATDLVGACLGATLVSVYLLPVFGFLGTAGLMAVVNLGPALAARRAGAVERRSSGGENFSQR